MVAVTASIQDKHDDSEEEEQRIRSIQTSELHNPRPTTPTSIQNSSNLHLPFPTTSQLGRKRSTEEMSPKQESIVWNRNLKKFRAIGLIDEFGSFSPPLTIKIEPDIGIKSETPTLKTRAQIKTAEKEKPIEDILLYYTKEEIEKDTSESDLTSNPDT